MIDDSMQEFEFIQWMQAQNKNQAPVIIGSGDDAAVIDIQAFNQLAISTDTIVENIDFLVKPETLFGIGWKALCISISDIAAMGLAPLAATCTMSVPPELTDENMKTIYQGLKAAADQFHCPVIGGDMSTAPANALSLTSTVLGYDPGPKPSLRPLQRNGAQVGDVIAVTGKLGGSILHHHLNFHPRVDAALALNTHYTIHAMIDISDGLTGDLAHICNSSNCGCLLEANNIPISASATQLSATSGKTPLFHALHDGEDFELLFTLSPEQWDKLKHDKDFPATLTAIGSITEKPILIRSNNQTEPLKSESFTHHFG